MQEIKVVNQLYEDLKKMRRPGEDVVDVIVRLIDLSNAVNQIHPILKGQAAYREWEMQRENAKELNKETDKGK